MIRTHLLALAFVGAFAAGATTNVAAAATGSEAGVPAGVRLMTARLGGDGNPFGRNRGRNVIVFADSSSRPLYVLTGAAECAGACLEKWRPALAASGAKATGDWTLTNSDGGKQWSFRGKPVFTLAAEKPFYAQIDDGEDRRGFAVTPAIGGEGQDGMSVARAEPAAWTKMPNGIGATEYRMAPGQVLAVDVGGATPLGKPLYVFTGGASAEKKLPGQFRPRYAAELDLPVGDFTVRERADGTRQWAFRGAPLYTCDCDVESGDLNGAAVAKGVEVAALLRYPMPAEVAIVRHNIAGGYMVEKKTGQMLYYRDRVKDGFDPDNSRPLGGPHTPTIGTTLGLKHCDAACEKEWQPLLAPKDAQPQGYWSIYERPDGKRQWAYKNFAIYKHAGSPPGTLYGNETYQIAYNERRSDTIVPPEFGLGLLWRALMP